MKKYLKTIKKVLNYIRMYFLVFVGSVIAAAALELFLIPNNIIDGGVVGVSILISHITQIPLQVFLVVINIPFLIVGYKKMGKGFVLASFFAIGSLAFWTDFLQRIDHVTGDVVLASVFGGLLLGIGVGFIIRFGGALDGTEIVAIILSNKTSMSIGQIVMIFNVFIFGASGFIFGWDKAMYAVLTYFVAFKTIDVTINGFNELKSATIVTSYGEKVKLAMIDSLDGGITITRGSGGFTNEDKCIIYTVIPRLEIGKLKAVVLDVDPNAFISFSDVFDVIGGRQKTYSI